LKRGLAANTRPSFCGRYSITLPPEAIRQIFQTHGELPNWPAYDNAAPTTALPISQAIQDEALHRAGVWVF
jgi:hypothetical protein